MKTKIFTLLSFLFSLASLFAQNSICPQPDYCDRDCWAPGGVCPEDPTPVYTDVEFIIVHHSAANYPADQDYKAVVRSYWDYHVNTHGWDDIGYNWLVDPNGVIYEGRGKDIKGAHFSGANSNTMGVCIIGDYMTTTPTNNSIQKLEDLIAWEASRKDIDVLTTGYHSASGLTLYHISGHRDGPTTTDCPGDKLYALLPSIRREVSQYPCYNGEDEGAPNDLCENAFRITSKENEAFDIGSVDKAHYESLLPKISCDDYANPAMQDVFFVFKAVEDIHQVKVVPYGDMDPVVAVYQGDDCNHLTEISCSDNGGGEGGTETFIIKELVPDENYWIRIYDYGEETPETPYFRIAVTHGTLSADPIVENSFLIYPNPSKNKLNIKAFASGISRLKIYSFNGILLMQKNELNKKEYSMEISSYKAGIYFLWLQDEKEKIFVYKFIKN